MKHQEGNALREFRRRDMSRESKERAVEELKPKKKMIYGKVGWMDAEMDGGMDN